jgi:hypothetical protein
VRCLFAAALCKQPLYTNRSHHVRRTSKIQSGQNAKPKMLFDSRTNFHEEIKADYSSTTFFNAYFDMKEADEQIL